MDLSEYIESRFTDYGSRLLDLESKMNSIMPNSKDVERQEWNEKWNTMNVNRTLQVGTVVDNRDKHQLGRILVRIHGRHHPRLKEEKLEIVEPIHPFGGMDDCGSNWVPPVGSQVAVLFSGGLLGQGYYLGTIPRGEILDERGNPLVGQRSIRLFDRRWGSSYNYRNEGHLGSLENEDLPPWSTESYRKVQRTAAKNQEVSEPSIYGFKTPEKHMLKMCDGFHDQKLLGKRLLLQSSKGNLLYMKDDILNIPGAYEYGSPEAQPDVVYEESQYVFKGAGEGESIASESHLRGNLYETYPILPDDGEDPWGKITHTPNDHVVVSSTYLTSGLWLQGEDLPDDFERSLKADPILPMTGVALQSIMGGRILMDDRFDAQDLEDDDNAYNKFKGIKSDEDLWSYVKIESISEHSIVLSDQESRGYRSPFNGIFIESALGNSLSFIDHMDGDKIRGGLMGVVLQSTTGHQIRMYDGGGELENSKRRKTLGSKVNGRQARFLIKSGFGQRIEMNDGPIQEEPGDQSLSIIQPDGEGSQNAIILQNGPDGKQQLVHIKAARLRIDSTASHHIRNVGGYEVVRRNQGSIEINKNFGTDFAQEGGALAPSVEFASQKLVFAEGDILLYGGKEGLASDLDGAGTDDTGGTAGAASAGGGVDENSVAPVVVDTVGQGIPCPLMPDSGFGCIFIGKGDEKNAHVSPSVRATRRPLG